MTISRYNDMTERPNVALSDAELEEVRKRLGREPNETEWAMLDIMWSEHAGYKSSRKYLKLFPTEAPHVLLPVGDDCGIVEFDDKYGIAIAMESHNHPSAIEPVAGAATGVGGIVRDILSKGARPIACTDPLRLGDIRNNERSKYLFENIVKGIADYGNCIGVPTVGGQAEFDSSFNKNPLVNVVCVGLVEKDKIITGKAKKAGDTLLLVGSKTGRDGIHGVTFASEELAAAKEEESRPAVQIEDPLSEKLLIDSCLEAYATGYVVGCKDLGGGGFTCATSEICGKAGFGGEIDLDQIHLREPDMEPWEILLSETQERMMLVVDKDHVLEVTKIFDKWDVPYRDVGRVIAEDRFVIKKGGEIIVDLPPSMLADGPAIERPFKEPEGSRGEEISIPDLKKHFEDMLGDPDFASKHWIYQQYDHEVQTRSVTKPGTDACVLQITENEGIAFSSDCNSHHCYLDPYKGAQGALAEGLRNITCAGARPLTIVDCLNFGNPEKPESMWEFVEAITGLADGLKSYGIPVVSGNVSFYNEAEGHAIEPSPVVTVLGKLKFKDFVTMELKDDGDSIILIGETKDELGKIPGVDMELEKTTNEFVLSLLESKKINAVHDLSAGGLARGLARMAFRSKKGFTVDISGMEDAISDAGKLFSETNARYVVTTKDARAVLSAARDAGLVAQELGAVGGPALDFGAFNIDLDSAHKTWWNALEKYLI